MTSRFALIDRLDAISGNGALIEADGRRITPRELAARARAIAQGFRASGMAQGDRVLFGVRPSIDAIASIIGIIEAGGVVVPVAVGSGDAVFASQMRLIQPRWVIAESALLAAAGSAFVRRIVRWRGGVLPSLDAVRHATFIRVGRAFPVGPRATSLEKLAKRAKGVEIGVTVDEREALVVFTSGTTATPKAVVHTRRSLAATLEIVAGALAIGPDGVLYSRDLHLILPALFAGARVVIPKNSAFSPERMLADIERFGVTHAFMVTGDCQALVEHVSRTGGSLPASIRQMLIGAAPVRAGFLERLRRVLPANAKAWCVYGMTEMLPVASISLDEKLAYHGDGDIVGRLVPGVTARTAEWGELVVNGPHLFAGYLGGDPVCEHATGDVARIDGDRVVLLGRTKDMIIRREHNIYPELHEPVIERIAGVRRAAMVGVYDEQLADERVVLAVEAESWCDEATFVNQLRAELREGPSRIDDAAQPDHIIVLPLPESGRSRKIDKEALRAVAREQLRCALP